MGRGKKFAMIRVGLLDHMGLLGRNPDAALVYLWCHLQTPLQGSRAGTVPVHMGTLGERLGWSRQRVGRAMRWLRMNPTEDAPWMVQVTAAGRDRGADYYIRNYDGSQPNSTDLDVTEMNIENNSRCNGSEHRADISMRPRCYESEHRSELAPLQCSESEHRQSLYTRASEEQESSRIRRVVMESNQGKREAGKTIFVGTNEEARQELAKLPHIAAIQGDDNRELAIDVAMQHLDAYGIAIDPDKDPAAEAATVPGWKDPFA